MLSTFRRDRGGKRQQTADSRFNLATFFEVLAERTGKVIIDSSKSLEYLNALVAALPGWDVKVLHILREPIEVARSQNKWMAEVGERQHSEVALILQWLQLNWKYKMGLRAFPADHIYKVSYERFILDQDDTITDILNFLGVPPIFNSQVQLRTLHTLGGTPSRFESNLFILSKNPHWRESGANSLLGRHLSRIAWRACITPSSRAPERNSL
jgi:hypothetical protein